MAHSFVWLFELYGLIKGRVLLKQHSFGYNKIIYRNSLASPSAKIIYESFMAHLYTGHGYSLHGPLLTLAMDFVTWPIVLLTNISIYYLREGLFLC